MKQIKHANVMVSLFLYNFEFFYFYADILYDGIDVANAIKRITDSRLLQVISNHDKFCKSLISNRDKAKQKRFGDILELVCYPFSHVELFAYRNHYCGIGIKLILHVLTI